MRGRLGSGRMGTVMVLSLAAVCATAVAKPRVSRVSFDGHSPSRATEQREPPVLWPDVGIIPGSPASSAYRWALWNFLGPDKSVPRCMMAVESGLGGTEYSVHIEVADNSASVVYKKAQKDLGAAATEALAAGDGPWCRAGGFAFGSKDVGTRRVPIPLQDAAKLGRVCEAVLLRVGYGDDTAAVVPGIHFATASPGYGLLQGLAADNATAMAFREMEGRLADYGRNGHADSGLWREIMARVRNLTETLGATSPRGVRPQDQNGGIPQTGAPTPGNSGEVKE